MSRQQFRSVFITGASSGLGRGLALHYAREGATVHAAARRRAELESLVHDAADAGAVGRIVPVVLDVVDEEDLVARLAAAEAAADGGLDLVIANAGVSEPTSARKMDWRKVKRVLDLNVSASAVTVAAALPAMVARGRGTVVGVSSLAAIRGFPGNAAYCASKAALHVFMESLRVDLRGTGVRAVTIYPGFVKTEMTAKNRFPMPFLMELDDAVRRMTDGIARGEPTISFPLPARALIGVLSAIPRSLYEPVAGRRGR
jgi:NAD(P)-dependent dehydrogenase (short-subunit alcohol dehydrogenase family)